MIERPSIRHAILSLPFLMVIIPFFCIFYPAIVHCQNPRAIQPVPDQEKRSAIQTVDGYAYLSENMTLAQTRTAAFANAKRQALEAARTYIQSKTKVKNLEVEYDLIWSDAEGSVTVLEQKDHGVEENSRYHIWIKAEVMYDLRSKQPEPLQEPIMNKDAPLTVKVWTDKKHYNTGDCITIFVQGNRDFYARIVDITTGGDIIQLLPNDFRAVNFFKSGIVYKIPDKGDHFNLNVTPPYGEDRIVVYASEVPLGEISMDSIGQGLKRYRGTVEALSTQIRGIMPTATMKGVNSSAEFYEATWQLTTRP
jgi:hypothetical protein